MTRRPVLIWLLFILVTGAIFFTYASTSLTAGHGEFVLPLDDVYIHFQYARQIALGQPYVYNPGQPPTSGATSFIYPYVLAVGCVLGFQELRLSLWAMMIGALALLGSLWLVYKLLKAHEAPDWLAVLVALIFGVTGPISWHFMAGMETGLMMLFTLAALYGVVTQHLRWFVLSASLLALTRPEGGVLAGIGVVVFFVEVYRRVPLRQSWTLIIPILAIFVQPLVNLLVTGSAVATGNSAKSIFGTVPFYWDEVIRRILDNFARMWAEFIIGVSPREGLYVPYLLGPLALAFLVGGLFSRRYRLMNTMLLLWLLAGTASIATLDTAFWHFKRYQMPLLALLFPAAGWAITEIQRKGAKAQRAGSKFLYPSGDAAPLRYVIMGVCGLGLIVALTTGAAFLQHFALNVGYVYAQPLQMARWLQANTPEDAVVAVHDVGMMRYMGRRTTLDMVGLTTPGAAAYWRNGPGSVAEFLIQERPDYIASYGKGHGLGLELIANTRIYGEPLAEFPVELDPNYNVALAADYQGIYQPDWSSVWLDLGLGPFQTINVGNLLSEANFDYRWVNPQPLPGFATEVHEFPIGCVDSPPPCTRLDSTRLISGYEEFDVWVSDQPDLQVVIYSYFYGTKAGMTRLYVDGTLIDENWIPVNPGGINMAVTHIPRDSIHTRRLHIRVETDTPYMIYRYQILQVPGSTQSVSEGLASYQNDSLVLLEQVARIDAAYLVFSPLWYSSGHTEGDFRFFVHLYEQVNQPPVAQADAYLNGNWVPLGNLGRGAVQDEIAVDLSTVPPGNYKLAIGFYNPYTGERLMPESDVYEVSADGRLWLDDVVIPDASE